VLAIGWLRNKRERSTKGKAERVRKTRRAGHHLRLEKGIRRRKALFEFGGLSF
jgi:hypothetical protein